jgi:hypothetical protein
VWTQHAYHVTNATSAGNVPLVEDDNWSVPGLNNYRQNVQGDGVFNAPDLAVELSIGLDTCENNQLVLRARVTNLGALGVRPGVAVTFHRGTSAAGPVLGTAMTTVPLLPGQSTILSPPSPIRRRRPTTSSPSTRRPAWSPSATRPTTTTSRPTCSARGWIELRACKSFGCAPVDASGVSRPGGRLGRLVGDQVAGGVRECWWSPMDRVGTAGGGLGDQPPATQRAIIAANLALSGGSCASFWPHAVATEA